MLSIIFNSLAWWDGTGWDGAAGQWQANWVVSEAPPANTKWKIESFEEIGTDDGMGNISNDENMRKRSTKADIEFEHALAIGFNARSVDSLEGKTTVKPLVICEVRGVVLTSAPESIMKGLPE